MILVGEIDLFDHLPLWQIMGDVDSYLPNEGCFKVGFFKPR